MPTVIVMARAMFGNDLLDDVRRELDRWVGDEHAAAFTATPVGSRG